MEYTESYSLYKLDKLDVKSLISLANEWLNNGIYTDSLNDLCWLDNPVIEEAGPIFEKAMLELGVKEQSRLEAAQNLITIELKRIVNKEISAEKGASFIYWEVHHEITSEIPDNEYVGDNLGLEHIFCWLREIWDCNDGSMILYHSDLSRPEAEKKFISYLIEESIKWLEKNT